MYVVCYAEGYITVVCHSFCMSCILAPSSTDTLRKLKKVFDGFRDAAKTYLEVQVYFNVHIDLLLDGIHL